MTENLNHIIDYELERAQKTLISLYKISLKLGKIEDNKAYPFNIYIGDDSDLADGTIDKRTLESKKEIFEKLEKEKIVANFTGPKWEDEYPSDYSEYGNSYCYVNGEFYPNDVLLCLEKIWKPKQKLSKEIVSYYETLKETVKTYLTNPLSGNDLQNHELNELYCLLSEKVKELYKNVDKSLTESHLDFSPYIPFSTLFSAVKELKTKKISRTEIIANMEDFYGKLKDIEKSFNLKTYEDSILDIKEVRSRIKQLQKELSKKKNIVKLKNRKIYFDNDSAKIRVDDLDCPLPPYGNEHFFCREAFKYKKGEWIDWSVIYEGMTNDEPKDKIKNKRTIIDTVYAINKRVSEVINTDDDLFSRKDGAIKRSF